MRPADERRITGRTQVMTLLADPIAHVVGTETITRHMRGLGVDMVCVPVHVSPADLPSTFATLRRTQNIMGSGITIPHKIPAASLVDDLTPRARLVGSINYVRRDRDGRLIGDNVDGAGFIVAARQHGIEFASLDIFQLGAGGAGRSVAFALAEAGVARLSICNRDKAKGQQLARDVAVKFPAVVVEAADRPDPHHRMVVNTTSVGMHGREGTPLDVALLRHDMIVADIILVPERTELLLAAEALGCQTIGGQGMLDAQMQLLTEFMGLGEGAAS